MPDKDTPRLAGRAVAARAASRVGSSLGACSGGAGAVAGSAVGPRVCAGAGWVSRAAYVLASTYTALDEFYGTPRWGPRLARGRVCVLAVRRAVAFLYPYFTHNEFSNARGCAVAARLSGLLWTYSGLSEVLSS